MIIVNNSVFEYKLDVKPGVINFCYLLDENGQLTMFEITKSEISWKIPSDGMYMFCYIPLPDCSTSYTREIKDYFVYNNKLYLTSKSFIDAQNTIESYIEDRTIKEVSLSTSYSKVKDVIEQIEYVRNSSFKEELLNYGYLRECTLDLQQENLLNKLCGCNNSGYNGSKCKEELSSEMFIGFISLYVIESLVSDEKYEDAINILRKIPECGLCSNVENCCG